MSYTTASGRQQIIDDTGVAVSTLDVALAEAGEAYEHLDERTADLMESAVFRPLQSAYSTLRRTRAEFAARYDLELTATGTAPVRTPHDARTSLEGVADAVESADEVLSDLQDSLLPVEVGDRELRSGLAETRNLLDPIAGACDTLIRSLGR